MQHHPPRPRVLILDPSMVSDPSQGAPWTADWRQWTDWAALGGHAVLGIALWWQSAGVGIMLLPVLLHQLLVESTGARAASERGFRALNQLHSLAPLALLVIAASIRPDWLVTTGDPALLTAGQAVWATGCVLGFASLWRLYRAARLQGASFIAERHPIYRAHLFTLAGLWLCHATLPFAALLALWLVTLALWDHYEAQAARATVQELGEWHKRVDALGARLATLTAVPEAARREESAEGATSLASPAPASVPAPTVGPDAEEATPAGRPQQVTDSKHHANQRMRRPRIDRIIPGLGRITVTPMVRCSPSCTFEVTSGGRRRRRHAAGCEVARRSQTIDRLVERGQLELLRAIKTGTLTIDEVHAREVGARQSAA